MKNSTQYLSVLLITFALTFSSAALPVPAFAASAVGGEFQLWGGFFHLLGGFFRFFNSVAASGSGSCPKGNAYTDGCPGAPTGTLEFPNLLDTQAVTALNVTAGSGYTNGTGYALSASGCGGSGFAGTIDVVGGSLTNA